jgi:hypothetical protein
MPSLSLRRDTADPTAGAHEFTKASRSHLKILGSTPAGCHETTFYTEHPQIPGATVQNSVATAT